MNKNAIRRRRRGSGGSLSGILFSASEPGFTFEPWDITTLYQDRAGTTPVTAAGQSVGYRRDKSGRGNHEVAVSDAKRGVYGWMPKTGRRNLLTYTEDFTNSAWTKDRVSVSANATIAPDGTTTADKVIDTLGGANTYRTYNSLTLSAIGYTQTFYAKAAEYSWCYVRIGTASRAWFNISDGTVGTVDAGLTASITSVGGGWYRISCTISTATAGAGFGLIGLANANGAEVYTPTTGGMGIYVWGAQLEVGSTATAYQRVVSQYDITEAGVQTCYYVQADGVDDAYVTPTITPNTDKVQVFAGVRKLSDAARGIFAEFSASIALNNGGFALTAPDAASATSAFESKGTVLSSAVASGLTAPITSVFSAVGDIAADTATLRRNGVQVATSATDQGTGNFIAYPAYIYGRGGTSFPFNGLDFGHAVRFGPNLSAATISRVESLIARNTPEVTL